MHFYKKQKLKRIVYSKVTIGVLCLLFILIAINTWDVYQKQRRAKRAVEEVRKEYDSLEARSVFLLEEINTLDEEEGVEATIRERFRVAKPGEKVIVLVDAQESTSEPKQEENGFWEKIKGWLGNE